VWGSKVVPSLRGPSGGRCAGPVVFGELKFAEKRVHLLCSPLSPLFHSPNTYKVRRLPRPSGGPPGALRGPLRGASQLTLINAKLQKEAEIRIQTPEENFREDEHNLESDPVTGFPVCESIDFSAASTESNSASPNCCCTPRARRVVNAGLGVAQMFGVPAPRIPPQLLSKASLKPSPPWTKVPQLPSFS